MGLKWESSEDTDVMSHLRKNTSAANEFASDLKSRVNAIINAVDGGELSGRGYNAAKSVFQELFLPIATAITNLTEDLNGNVSAYHSARGQVHDSKIDEDKLQKVIENLKQNNIHLSMQSGAGVINQAAIKKMAQNNKTITKIEKKIEDLQNFNARTAELFADAKAEEATIGQGIKYINSGSLSADGTFRAGPHTNLEWLSKLHKEEKKHNQIKSFMSAFSLTREQAGVLYEYERKFEKYAKKNKLSNREAMLLFSQLISAAVYTNAQYLIFGGMTRSAARKKLKDMHFSNDEIDHFFGTFTRTSKSTKDDFTHFMYSITMIITSDEKQYANTFQNGIDTKLSNKSFGYLDGFSTYSGDIASKSFGGKKVSDVGDVKADVDALNVINRVRSDNNKDYKQSPLQALNKYGNDISSGKVNRVKELYSNYGGKAAFEQKLKNPDFTYEDKIMQGLSGNSSITDDAARFKDKLNKVKNE